MGGLARACTANSKAPVLSGGWFPVGIDYLMPILNARLEVPFLSFWTEVFVDWILLWTVMHLATTESFGFLGQHCMQYFHLFIVLAEMLEDDLLPGGEDVDQQASPTPDETRCQLGAHSSTRSCPRIKYDGGHVYRKRCRGEQLS